MLCNNDKQHLTADKHLVVPCSFFLLWIMLHWVFLQKKWKFCFICFGDRVLLFQSWSLGCVGLLHGWSAGAHHPTQYSCTSFPKDICFVIILGNSLGVESLDYTETLTSKWLSTQHPHQQWRELPWPHACQCLSLSHRILYTKPPSHLE